MPDAKNNWLNQSNSNFESLIPLADRQTKLAKSVDEEQAVFGLYSLGVITARDEWMYDFDAACLGRKVRSFINEYEESRARHGGKIVEGSDLGTTIKWTRDICYEEVVFQPKLERNAVPNPSSISTQYVRAKQSDLLLRSCLHQTVLGFGD